MCWEDSSTIPWCHFGGSWLVLTDNYVTRCIGRRGRARVEFEMLISRMHARMMIGTVLINYQRLGLIGQLLQPKSPRFLSKAFHSESESRTLQNCAYVCTQNDYQMAMACHACFYIHDAAQWFTSNQV